MPRGGEGGVGTPSASRALAWQFASKYVNVAIQLVITAILARLVVPEQFGLVAIVTVFVSFFSILADIGISPAIVQYDDLSRADYDSLLTFTLLLGVALAALFCAVSPLVAAFYGDGLLVPLCCLSSPAILFSAANMVPNGILLKERRFSLIALRTIGVAIVSGVGAIALALAGLGCYALVAYSVMQAFLTFAWNYLGSSVRVGSVHFLRPLRHIFRYSAFQAAFSTVNYFARNLDNLLLGRYFGATTLGYYDRAYKLNMYPVTHLSGVVSSVLQPYLVVHKDEPGVIFRYYLQVAKGITLLGAWMSALLGACSLEITLILYGDQWATSAVLLRVLSASVMFQMLNSLSGALFQTLGRTDYMLYTSLVNTTLNVAGIVVGIASGGVGTLAMAVSLAYVLHTVSNTFFLVYKGFGEAVWPYVRAFLPELVVVVGGAVGGALLPGLMAGGVVVSLMAKAVVVTVAVLGLYAATGQLLYARSLLARLRGGGAGAGSSLA